MEFEFARNKQASKQEHMIQSKNVILLNSLWKFYSLIQKRLDFVYMACLAWPEASELNREFSYFPQLWLQKWGCNGLRNCIKEFRDVREEKLVLEKQAKCEDWAPRNQHCRLD